jgi:Rrf2 family transcriptional repressor of oqxAB
MVGAIDLISFSFGISYETMIISLRLSKRDVNFFLARRGNCLLNAPMIDIRFPTALQIMLSLSLAQERDEGLLNSGQLARSLGADRSFVRKAIVPLAEAGLINVSRGNTGGICLSRRAADISLREVYDAVTKEKPLWFPREGVPAVCLVSRNIRQYFEVVADEAQEAALAKLAETTLADGLETLRVLDSGNVRNAKARGSGEATSVEEAMPSQA